MSSRDDFTQASQAFIDVVAKIRPDQWALPGLGNWDVRSLVGHTARALLTVENYLALDEPGHLSMESAESYYATIYSAYTDPLAIEERGVEAGVWLGDDPLAMVREARARALESIDVQPPDRLVSICGLGITLDEYLRTRVFELVVHILDISRATEVSHSIGAGTLSNTVTLAAHIAVSIGQGETVLLALTGRRQLPDGFNVV